MKKYLILALCAVLSVGLITGCGSKKEDKKESNEQSNENVNVSSDLYDYSDVENDESKPWYIHYSYDKDGDLILGIAGNIFDLDDDNNFTGTIFNGKVSVGDTVDYLSYKGITKVTVEKIYIFPKNANINISYKEDLDKIELKEVNEAKAKENVLIITSKIDKDKLGEIRGAIIAKEDSISYHKEVLVKLDWIDASYGVKPYGTYSNYSAYYAFSDHNIDYIEIPEGQDTINPGDSITTKIVFKDDVPCDIGWEFTIRGGGKSNGKAVITNVY